MEHQIETLNFELFCGGNLLSHNIFYRFQNFMASVIMTCSNRSSVHNIISLVQSVKELLLRRNKLGVSNISHVVLNEIELSE